MGSSVRDAGRDVGSTGILRPVDDDVQGPRTRWWQRTLPVVGVVVVLLAVASLLSSTVREQIGLSASRKPTSYVELFFATANARPGGVEVACRTSGRQAAYSFALVSHLQRRTSVDYRVSVQPLKKGAFRAKRTERALPVSPGRTVLVRHRLGVPASKAYVVTVTLPGFDDQTIRARCRPAQG